jgi:hypothetical protein
MKKRKLLFTLLTISIVFVSLFLFREVVLAQGDPFGLDDLNLVLDNEVEPKSAIVNIINIVLGFLGLIAVIIVIYGGFVWMMSGGEAEKIDKAKKILKSGLIGIVIVLLSWGIATFVIGFFAGIGGGGGSNTCTVGESRNCGCNNAGTQVCQADGSWTNCTEGPCPPIVTPDIDCNLNPLSPICTIDQDECDPYGLVCSPVNCKCVAPGSVGSSCSSDPLGSCVPDDDKCGEYLSCNDECICEGSPVITEISPVGGFCEEDPDLPCVDDSGCTCNTDTPNGAENNLISIFGANFGNVPGEVFFGDALEGIEPSVVNTQCLEFWSDQQIIIAVPASSNDTMPIMVKTNDDKETFTNDGIGPNIPDFQFNTIARPGLCKLDPIAGQMLDNLSYYGVNMFGGLSEAGAYFGSYTQNVKAINSSFEADGKTLNASVPNVGTGAMSTFVQGSVLGTLLNSNYLSFYKQAEPDPLPYISSFEPTQGAPGQYVTIYGQGFGNQRGTTIVKIGNDEVNYDFPAVCADSVWRDDRIIIKVPTIASVGNYFISLEFPNGDIIDTSTLNPDRFEFDNNLSLNPSLCKISPIKGPIGQEVSLWGEYFGSPTSTARFNLNKDVEETVIVDGGADKLEVNVPDASFTGPVVVIDNDGNIGNSLNFEVGSCQADDECGIDNVCCPAGTYKEGRCANDLSECSLEIFNSVYQWSFSTDLGEIEIEEPEDPEDSCLGWSQKIGFCPTDQFCPNSPGKCSASEATEKGLNIKCGNDACADFGCTDCSYNSDLNICIPNSEIDCHLDNTFQYTLNGEEFSAYRSCQVYALDNQNRWHMSVNTSCPTGWFMTVNNTCVSDELCNACEDALLCRDIYNTDEGKCVSQSICPSNSYCDIDECKREVAGSCECCCEYGEDERDCCSPLQCKGTCGIGVDEEGTEYGSCYGCTVYDTDGTTILQDESNDACNCVGHINKYCDTTVVPDGVCGDCSAISDIADCMDQSTCCYDFKSDSCRGGQQIDIGDPNQDGYCAYYDQCDTGNPDVCDASIVDKDGAYNTLAECNFACSSSDEFCADFDNSADCADQNICCWDAKDGADVCRATIDGANGRIDSGVNIGFCAYYNCAETDPDECNIVDKEINGTYNNQTTCEWACPGPPSIGENCFSQSSNACDFNICSNPFDCLLEDGSPGVDGNCGRCCCEVSEPIDSCDFANTSDLTCQPDREPCSGAHRGLCCGCSDDNSCGVPDSIGCGADTCCRARPAVSQFIPKDEEEYICRNSVIKVKFDQFMDPSSLYSNIRLLEEKDPADGPCPSGTFFTQNQLKKPSTLLAKMWLSIKSLFTKSAVAYDPPTEGNLYCLVPGTINLTQSTSTTANFYPSELLKASTTYYILVIGDEDLDSQTGVLSSWQIGMNGTANNESFNTVEYVNSEISMFKTLGEDAPNSGVCALDYVKVMPDSYLFNRNDNDDNEDDSDKTATTFDTKRDKDKVFSASAYSIDHQEIQGVTGYDWDWDMDITLGSSTVINKHATTTVDDNQIFVEVNEDVRDDVAEITATIDMDNYNKAKTPACETANNCNTFFGGDGVYNTADIYVFICRNPWPSMKTDGSWEPFSYDYNSKFYYCRDFGSGAYVDDLPAVVDEPVAPLKGECSDTLAECTRDSDCSGGVCIVKGVCSLSIGTSCTSNDDCGEDEGICINRVFREAYFFRQKGPIAGTITSIENDDTSQLGGKIIIEWKGNKEYIYDSSNEPVGNSRIYYGIEGSSSMNYYDLSPEEMRTDQNNCAINGDEYECEYKVSGLENNETYIFRVSAISQSKIERMFENEKKIVVLDEVAPSAPTSCQINGYSPGDEEINISCNSETIDISYLRFYHGLVSGQYGQSFDGQLGVFSITLPVTSLNIGVTNYFAVTAIDAAGNESDKSIEMEVNLENSS